LQKTQYYKFLTENSSHKIQKTLKENRISVEKTFQEPQTDKQEEFKREIELRFQRSAMNPGYKFPLRIDNINTDSQNESSTDSLEQLSIAIRYDLHSQNLRSYAKLQDFPSMIHLKKALLGESNKLLEKPKPAVLTLQSPVGFELNHPLKHDLDIQSITKDRVKTEFYNDQSNLTSRETITTNDTAFSPLNRATLNNFFDHPKTAKNHQNKDFRQSTPRGVPFPKRSVSPQNANTKYLKGEMSAQSTYFASKKLTDFNSANTKIAYKKTAATGSRVSNINYGIQNCAAEISK
jgi:hypothetical protein